MNYVLGSEVGADVPMAMEILDADGEVVFAEYSPETRPDCPAAPRQRELRRTAGANRWSWDLEVGRFACIDEVTNTQRSLSAYTAQPGRYQVRLTVDDEVPVQDFQILIDPRLDGIAADPVAEYGELDRLSESLYQGAKEMEAGVLERRRIGEQLELRMEEAEALGAEAVLEGGTELTTPMEEWESRILQKHLETSQNNYMFEARLLIKFKDLLGRMAGANIPVTAGVREVTGDYLDEWAEKEEDLEVLKAEIRAFNEVLRSAGLPELYLGTPRPVT